MALFGPSAGARREPRSLVEFRAGKMTLRNRIVTPDKRKGLVFMKMDDGQLLHFCWKDRTSGVVEDDYIIFPGDADMKVVTQCTTGRVYLLHFKNNRKEFFWMQEPKDDKDEEYCKTVNDLIANPHSAEASGGELGGLQSLMGLDSRSLQTLLEGMDRQQVMELLNQGGLGGLPFGNIAGLTGSASSSRPSTGSRSRPDTAGVNQSQDPVSQTDGRRASGGSGASRSEPRSESTQQPQPRVGLSDLRSILSTLMPPGAATDGSTQGGARETPHINLSDAITPDALRRVGGDAEGSSHLRDHIPPSEEGVVPILTSPQFRQSLDVFGAALQSGQLGPLMTQFGLQQEIAQAAATGNVQSFAQALQSEMSSDTSAKGGEDKQGDKSKDDKPEGDKPEGDKPEGDKPGGDKPEGDKDDNMEVNQ